MAQSTHITITSGPGARPPQLAETIYKAVCGDVTYEISSQKTQGKVLFRGSERNWTDITGTMLGKNISSPRLYGRVSLTCLPDAVNILFSGYSLLESNSPSPVSMHATVLMDGTVQGGNLNPESDAYIARQLMD